MANQIGYFKDKSNNTLLLKDLYFMPGETLTMEQYVIGGYESSGRTEATGEIIFPKQLTYIKNITITAISCVLRDATDYCYPNNGTDVRDWVLSDFSQHYITKFSGNHGRLVLIHSAGYHRSNGDNSDNNGVMTIYLRSITFKFE